MTDEEVAIKQRAEEFARKNKNAIAKEVTDPSVFLPDEFPVSVFMAGSPGAGKTEYSKNLVDILEKDKKCKVVRIDGDELRERLPGYTGVNSHLFQGAMSAMVNSIHDATLRQKQSFILDGTFSKYERAADNINRSLLKNRFVFIFYVYQKPEIAWKFTQAREIVEGRNIPKDAFIRQFIGSRKTVSEIRKNFDKRVIISLVKKNFETHAVEGIFEIKHGEQIDDCLGQGYTECDLEKLL